MRAFLEIDGTDDIPTATTLVHYFVSRCGRLFIGVTKA
jgi:hypothetical protein